MRARLLFAILVVPPSPEIAFDQTPTDQMIAAAIIQQSR
jgi:hypothetical protein